MKIKVIAAMLISATMLISVCSCQGGGENKADTSPESGSGGHDTAQTSISDNSDSLKNTSGQDSVADAEHEAVKCTNDNNYVISESNGELYYRCNYNLLYHIIDDKNVELVTNNSGMESEYKDVSDPVLSKSFTGLDYSAAVGDNCFFSLQDGDNNSENYCCIRRFDLENGKIVKSTDLFDRKKLLEFYKKESSDQNTEENNYMSLEPYFQIVNLTYGNDGFVYFINLGNTYDYKIRPADINNYRIGRFTEDGSSIEYIGKENACAMEVYNGYIYYYDNGYKLKVTNGKPEKDYDYSRRGIYRMKTDGSEKEKLCSLKTEESDSVYKCTHFMRIIDGYIYFLSADNIISLSRIPINGGEPEKITDIFFGQNMVFSYCVDSDAQKVYFQDTFNGEIAVNKSDIGKDKPEVMIKKLACRDYFYQGFADKAGNYLYLNCWKNDNISMKMNKKLITDGEFTPDPENENCLIRPMPSRRYDLNTGKYEKIYEVLTFESKVRADEFLNSVDYSTVGKTTFEWRETDLEY